MSFNTPLILTLDKEYFDKVVWWVIQPFEYYSPKLDAIITVSCPFPTDLASVPRIPIIYDVFGNSATRPAVIHDYLCVSKIVDRKTADAIFLEAMEIDGMSVWKRTIMWIGVRLHGMIYP